MVGIKKWIKSAIRLILIEVFPMNKSYSHSQLPNCFFTVNAIVTNCHFVSLPFNLKICSTDIWFEIDM